MVHNRRVDMPGELPGSGIASTFRRIKARYPNHLILFEVGEFYEFYFEDAEAVSESLGLRLASRFSNSVAPIAMASVHRNVGERTVERLLKLGHSVGITSS